MPKPPDDDDSLFEELLAQVDEAFSALDLGREDLADGVRDALRAALRHSDEEDGPHVVVLEGGRDDDDEASEEPPPDLHVAEDPSDAGDVRKARSTVRVVRAGVRPKISVQETPLHLEGSLLVGAGEEQTVFRGEVARTYRLSCDAGTLEVAVDGRPADHVGSGQSMDVEARLIRVSSGDAKVSVGRYARIA